MKKIPTLFLRDPDHPRYVTEEVHPDCQWVLDGEGVPTRKYDGTCVMFDGDQWWVRREVKPGKTAPRNYQHIETDPNTEKAVGWEPINQSGFAKFHAEALNHWDNPVTAWQSGTYELIGPKINGNPEAAEQHLLIEHDSHMLCLVDNERDFETIREDVLDRYHRRGMEGVVWHHPDGRMAKIKARDFRSGDDL